MTLILAGKIVPSADGLSALGRLTLALIDGGMEWLAWAGATPSSRYEFADETRLVDDVQQGLHGSSLILLPKTGLMVGAAKLVTLGLTDLRMLAKAEGGDDSAVVATQVRSVLGAHRLVVSDDLTAARPWLDSLGVGKAAVFQALGFDERIAVLELLHSGQGETVDPSATGDSKDESGATPTMLQTEAAKFAVEQSRTPLEFTDYYKFYLDNASKQAAQKMGPSERNGSANHALQSLLPSLFNALDCPRIHGLPTPVEVARAAADWLGQGRQIGFARLSEAVQQVFLHSTYQDEEGDAARRVVEQYLQSAQAFLAGNPVRHSRMAQDGASCRYSLESESLRGLLVLSSDGVISLRDFGVPLSAPKPSAQSAGQHSIQEGAIK